MTGRLADVARKVGVSEATVSRVLNEKPGVSDATRARILTALDVLGYERPSKLRGELHEGHRPQGRILPRSDEIDIGLLRLLVILLRLVFLGDLDERRIARVEQLAAEKLHMVLPVNKQAFILRLK